MSDKDGAVPIYTVWWQGECGYDYEFAGAFTTREYAEASVDNLELYSVEAWWLYDRPKRAGEEAFIWDR